MLNATLSSLIGAETSPAEPMDVGLLADELRRPAGEAKSETVKSEMVKPEWLLDLYALSKDLSLDDPTETCKWFGLPSGEDCPSPGQARIWEVEDWAKWAEEHKLVPKGETAHTRSWEHPQVPAIILGIAKTPGDWRAAMNAAMQIRRYVRMYATRAHFLVRRAVERGLPTQAATPDSFKEFVFVAIQQKDFGAKAWEFSDASAGMSVHNAGQLRKLMARFSAEFPGISPRNAVLSLVRDTVSGDSIEAIDKIFEFVKLADEDAAIPAEVYEHLHDHMLYLRQVEVAEKEAKRLKRDAEVADREARKVQAVSVTGLLQAKAAAHAAATQKSISAALQAAQSTIDRLRAISVTAIEIPVIDDPAPYKVRVSELEAKLAASESRFHEAEAVVQTLGTELASVDRAKIKMSDDVQAHLLAFASLVVEGVNTARSAGPFQLVDIFTSLSNEAQAVLDKYHGQKPVDRPVGA